MKVNERGAVVCMCDESIGQTSCSFCHRYRAARRAPVMIALHLYWKRDGDDVDLGTGYDELLLPPGSLLVHVTDHGTVWRVKTILIHLAQAGSMAVRSALDGRRCDWPMASLFVEPAEGPFEP